MSSFAVFSWMVRQPGRVTAPIMFVVSLVAIFLLGRAGSRGVTEAETVLLWPPILGMAVILSMAYQAQDIRARTRSFLRAMPLSRAAVALLELAVELAWPLGLGAILVALGVPAVIPMLALTSMVWFFAWSLALPHHTGRWPALVTFVLVAGVIVGGELGAGALALAALVVVGLGALVLAWKGFPEDEPAPASPPATIRDERRASASASVTGPGGRLARALARFPFLRLALRGRRALLPLQVAPMLMIEVVWIWQPTLKGTFLQVPLFGWLLGSALGGLVVPEAREFLLTRPYSRGRALLSPLLVGLPIVLVLPLVAVVRSGFAPIAMAVSAAALVLLAVGYAQTALSAGLDRARPAHAVTASSAVNLALLGLMTWAQFKGAPDLLLGIALLIAATGIMAAILLRALWRADAV